MGRYPGGAGYPPHPWITAEHTAVMAWVGLSISGPIDGKRGSASNNERTTRQNTPAGCQIGPAGVISVCGKYPHTYTRIQISGKSRTRASKPPAGLAGFRGGGLHGTGKAARRDTSPTAPRFPPPVARSSAQAANYIPTRQNAAQRPAGAFLRGRGRQRKDFVTRHTREFLDTTTREGFMTR